VSNGSGDEYDPRGRRKDRHHGFTQSHQPREVDILRDLMTGATNQRIAEVLRRAVLYGAMTRRFAIEVAPSSRLPTTNNPKSRRVPVQPAEYQ
jgi:hypothetical protein